MRGECGCYSFTLTTSLPSYNDKLGYICICTVYRMSPTDCFIFFFIITIFLFLKSVKKFVICIPFLARIYKELIMSLTQTA